MCYFQVYMSTIFILLGLFHPAILTSRIDVVENVDESDDKGNETSTTNDTNSWSASTNPEHMQRITEPVIITSPQEDKKRNFTASPMVENSKNHFYFRGSQEVKASTGPEYSSKEHEGSKTKQYYSQPLPPDVFLTQQYLKAQQQKEREDYESRNNNKQFPKPVFPEAKHNFHSINSEDISYKPVKYDFDYVSSSSKETDYDKKKETTFQFSLSSPIKGSTHPYPYQNPFSNGEKDSSSKKTPVSGKENSWSEGYKAGIAHQEG